MSDYAIWISQQSFVNLFVRMLLSVYLHKAIRYAIDLALDGRRYRKQWSFAVGFIGQQHDTQDGLIAKRG